MIRTVRHPTSAKPPAFRFRLARRADLPACLQLLPETLRTTGHLPRITRLWETLIQLPSPLFTVIEDMARVHPSSIEAFGASVFVTEALLERLSADPQPHLAAAVYDHALANGRDVLSASDIARANTPSAGLHAVVMHFGLRNPDMSDVRTQQAVQLGSAAFYFTHSGYQLKSLLNEVHGEQHKRFMEAGGFRLHCDFRARSPTAFRNVPPTQYPYLFQLRKHWIEPGAVNPLAQLFHPSRPFIHFSAAEQRVLVRSLLNESDAAIAGDLGVSVDAVKKVWRAIYERVNHQADFLIKSEAMPTEGRRSQEKRRYLLDYLRTHLEELRPYERPR